MYLNEATLLNNVRVRYSKDKIYVSSDLRVKMFWLKIFIFVSISFNHLLKLTNG